MASRCAAFAFPSPSLLLGIAHRMPPARAFVVQLLPFEGRHWSINKGVLVALELVIAVGQTAWQAPPPQTSLALLTRRYTRGLCNGRYTRLERIASTPLDVH